MGLMMVFAGTDRAFAALVSSQITGQITYVDSTWSGGVAIGDPVTGSVTYDSSLIPATAFFALSLDSNSAFGIELSFGSYRFTTTDDKDYGSGLPQALFNDGILTGIDFVVPLAEGGMIATHDWFAIDNAAGAYVLEGSMTFHAGTVVVPLPAAGWLLISGLFGLIAAARRTGGTRPS